MYFPEQRIFRILSFFVSSSFYKCTYNRSIWSRREVPGVSVVDLKWGGAFITLWEIVRDKMIGTEWNRKAGAMKEWPVPAVRFFTLFFRFTFFITSSTVSAISLKMLWQVFLVLFTFSFWSTMSLVSSGLFALTIQKVFTSKPILSILIRQFFTFSQLTLSNYQITSILS